MSERPRITVAEAFALDLSPKEVLNILTALNMQHGGEFEAVHNEMALALDERRLRESEDDAVRNALPYSVRQCRGHWHVTSGDEDIATAPNALTETEAREEAARLNAGKPPKFRSDIDGVVRALLVEAAKRRLRAEEPDEEPDVDLGSAL